MDQINKVQFLDPIGRPSDKPNNVEHGITDNPHLFLGEYALLLAYLNRLDYRTYKFLQQNLIDCEVERGLFTRHPTYLLKTYNIPPNKMSHDENNGIAFMGVACPILQVYVKDMVDYLDAHHNQYYDLEPDSDFIKALKSNPIDAIKKLRAYLADVKANPHDTNAVDLRHDGNISALSSWRQPRDVAFYKLAAGQKSSLFGTINLCIATLLSTRKTIDDGSRGGTILMAWFRNLALKKLKIRGFKGRLISQSISLFNSIMRKKYGNRFPEVLINAYFDRIGDNGERHHMISLVSELLDKQPNL